MKRINVLGNYSGRNAGDAAILGGLLEDIVALQPDVRFTIPTINTRFVRQTYADYPVKPVSLLPWTLSLKILGLPTLISALRADLILVTDAILFDRKLYNPLFNYLYTLSRVLPLAKRFGVPVVLYNCSLGPIRTPQGLKALKRVIKSASMVILRDVESRELLQKLGIDHPQILEGADCALNAQAADDRRFQEICRREGLFASSRGVVGFNINSYVDAFVRQDGKTFGREQLIELYARTADRVIQNFDVDVIFVETQHMDLAIAEEVVRRIPYKERVRLISNRQYSYGDICAILKRMELFVGMRTHSLILSSTMGVPPVGIVTYPKNRGYMRTINREKNLIEFRDLSYDTFFEKIRSAFLARSQDRVELVPAVEREKIKARKSADYLKPFLL
ncbi:polysaccharide pyruvyl transferase family protein [candidate division KSB1 bacterium]|nr:polysaccharide pyruvyl transferase family protein [candidate division KSB1 bacterium]